MSDEKLSWFHWRDGWYFARTATGTVLIQRRTSFEDTAPSLSVEIPAPEWASIISHVSARGEAESYADAVRFHAASARIEPATPEGGSL